MGLQTSGAISLNDMHVEVGSTSGTTVAINNGDIRDLIGKASKAQSSFSEFYGASSAPDVGFGALVYSETALRDQWSQGSTSSDMSGDWNLQASCSAGNFRVGKYSDLLMPSNRRIYISYDATITGYNGFESALWITYIPNRSSPKTGFNKTVSESSSDGSIRRELLKWRSATNGGLLYSADADTDGSHKLYTRNYGPSGRFQGSFWFDLRSSGKYQIGLELVQTPSGASTGAVTMHSMTVT
jgi:hypothetical protein